MPGLVHLGVTARAGRLEARGVGRGSRVARRENVVGAVAGHAGGDVGDTVRIGDPVKRPLVALDNAPVQAGAAGHGRVLVALGAGEDDPAHRSRSCLATRGLDAVDAVAVDAGGGERRPVRQGRPVDAPGEGRAHLGVARAAGVGDPVAVDRRLGIVGGPHPVRPVATEAAHGRGGTGLAASRAGVDAGRQPRGQGNAFAPGEVLVGGVAGETEAVEPGLAGRVEGGLAGPQRVAAVAVDAGGNVVAPVRLVVVALEEAGGLRGVAIRRGAGDALAGCRSARMAGLAGHRLVRGADRSLARPGPTRQKDRPEEERGVVEVTFHVPPLSSGGPSPPPARGPWPASGRACVRTSSRGMSGRAS